MDDNVKGFCLFVLVLAFTQHMPLVLLDFLFFWLCIITKVV